MSRLIPLAATLVAFASTPAFATEPGSVLARPDTARHQIFTLAWTDIRLPRSLQTQPTSPAASAESNQFVLSWVNPPRSSEPRVLASARASECTVTVLVTQSC